MPHVWRDRFQILDKAHEPELESRAAIHEIGENMPRAAAEARAHEGYLHGHILRSAAHHLAGMRAATAAGDTATARQHHLHYAVMLGALGHDAHGEPPAEVAAMAKDPAQTPVYRFKNHGADAVALEFMRRRQAKNKKSPPIAKSEGVSPFPVCGLQTEAPGVWDCSNHLPPDRRAAGEKLYVREFGNQRQVAHLGAPGADVAAAAESRPSTRGQLPGARCWRPACGRAGRSRRR
jgi:hypothetical protein